MEKEIIFEHLYKAYYLTSQKQIKQLEKEIKILKSKLGQYEKKEFRLKEENGTEW